MATLKDISRSIAGAHNLKGREAEAFASAIVDTILEGLEADRVVKIKGFGTFKLTAVKDRQSVNVNTGERVVISGHDKISFTPENSVRDLINKPFAQFDTVPLSDSISNEFATSATEVEEVVESGVEEVVESGVEQVEAVVEEQVEAVVEERVEAVVEEQVEAVVEEVEAVAEQVEAVVEQVEPVVEEQPEPTVETETETTEEDDSTEEVADTQDIVNEIEMEEFKNKIIKYAIVANVLVAIIAFVAGYYCNELNLFGNKQEAEIVEAQVADSDTAVAQKPVAAVKPYDTVSVTNVEKQIEEQEKKEAEEKAQREAEEKAKQEAEAKAAEKTVAKQQQSAADESSKYDVDPRVRTGAYKIIGVDQTVTVKDGQTLKSISKSYLGPDMECYVEALNGTKEVKAGDKLRIPKLVLKKRVKKD